MANKCGYPNPGPQNLSVKEVIDNLPFMSDIEWELKRITEDFDYVIIGSSFCAMGFIHQALKNNPNAKILIMERGDYVPPKDFQALSPLDLGRVEKKSETFHWQIHTEDEHINYVRGVNNLFGGRSSFWKAWCPTPTREEMPGWPDAVIAGVEEYFPAARTLLNVQRVDEMMEKGEKVFRELQQSIFKALEDAPSQIEAIKKIDHASLAVTETKSSYGDHMKYSALGPLLKILEDHQNVQAVVHCLVTKIRHESGKATFLETSKGDFTLGDAKLILAMSTLPSTTLMLNSFPLLRGIGTRFTAHLVSVVCARVPLQRKEEGRLEMAAIYVRGENNESKHQFHIQLTAVDATVDATHNRSIDHYNAMRRLLKTPSQKQLESSKGHRVFLCACLGQLDKDNSVGLNDDTDTTCNTTLRVATNDKDKALWDTMDSTTFQMLEKCLTPSGEIIEYWNYDAREWRAEHPQIRRDALVHPASTMWIGSDTSSPVNLEYQFRGVGNVYLTGGALWPTGASWNPTCAMTAMAMHLADTLKT